MRLLSFFYSSVLALALTACPSNTNTGGGGTTGFDRRTMITSYADRLILPNYTDLQQAIGELEAATNTFSATPNTTNLAAAQVAWDKACAAWQHCAMFDFGPADAPLGMLSQELGTFPCSASLIESSIRQRNFTTSNFQRDTRGFSAIEYLLFSDSTVGASAERVVTRFVNDSSRAAVLRAMVSDAKAKVGNVISRWSEYRSGFVSNDGTSVGSSTSLLFNTFVANFETLKNFKFGVPAGLRAGQTRTEPQRVEALYSGRSLKFAKEHLTAIENLWTGRTKTRQNIAAQDFIGFEEYLTSVQGGAELVANTKTQLTNAKNALATIPDIKTLSQTIEANPAPVNATFTELQKLTRFFKSDMSSLLGLQITYSSGDGD
jgi:predicted lipoprotein